jgi:hypothetical protein
MNWYHNNLVKEASVWKGLIPLLGLSLVLTLIQIGFTPQQVQQVAMENGNNPEATKSALEQVASKSQPGFSPMAAQPQEPATTQPATSQPVDQAEPNMMVARVIFSEANDDVSDMERRIVATVIENRIDHPGFSRGRLESMEGVVRQPKAFSAINDPDNLNWEQSASPDKIPSQKQHAWDHSLSLSTGNFEQVKSPSGRPLVYYHDNSISMPPNWSNKYWTAVEEIRTPNFTAYSVVPTRKE